MHDSTTVGGELRRSPTHMHILETVATLCHRQSGEKNSALEHGSNPRRITRALTVFVSLQEQLLLPNRPQPLDAPRLKPLRLDGQRKEVLLPPLVRQEAWTVPKHPPQSTVQRVKRLPKQAFNSITDVTAKSRDKSPEHLG